MRSFIILYLLFFGACAFGADVKISQLPLGNAATSGINDSFPYVAASTNITKRLTIWDIANIPTVVAKYAPLASPTFTGTVTAPTFVGALTGNASTATALAANPSDCSSGQYANAIAANGNLTCSAVATSQLSGTVGVAQGGTGLASGTANQIIYFTGSTAIGQITTANSSALVTNGSGVPSFTSGSVANRVLRTDGSSLAFSQVAAATDISGQLPLANGGTNANLTAIQGGVLYSSSSALAVSAAGTSGQYLKSNGTSAPAFASFTAPTIQKFTSSSGTYTTPTSPAPIYIRVVMVGGGGGGQGSGTGGGSNGTAGGATTFGTSLLTANGGNGGSVNGGTGGSASLGTGPIGISLPGGAGGARSDQISTVGMALQSGGGGNSAFGGAGQGVVTTTAGGSGATNTGGGGAGAGLNGNISGATGAGGGSGGYIDAIITSPASTYAYCIGNSGGSCAGGGGGGAGTSGAAGGAGGTGLIVVYEYYQ